MRSGSEPADQLVAVAAEHVVRIAAEGRKFGLYLLVSTQRPQKIPENVLSQADNLELLRLTRSRTQRSPRQHSPSSRRA